MVYSTSASETENISRISPRLVRRKKVFENLQARNLRQEDQERQKQQEQRRKILLTKLARSGGGLNNDCGSIIINESKYDNEGFVYVNENIAKRIKKHQIDGIRFMWNQLITDSKNNQGCLLAHTMGLGKTMQVYVFQIIL
jgi:SNF2 family DNA or RNA helicase